MCVFDIWVASGDGDRKILRFGQETESSVCVFDIWVASGIFYESPQTGVGGAAKNLIKELKKAGIKTEFRKLPEDAIRKSLDK